MRRRVVVTGIGWVTPLGVAIEPVWQRLLAGESGVDYITQFDAENFPTRIAAEVPNWKNNTYGEPAENWVDVSRHTHFAIAAARQAVSDAGLEDGNVDPTRFGVYTGSGEGSQDFHRFAEMITAATKSGEYDPVALARAGFQLLNGNKELEREPNRVAGHLAGRFNAQGPNANCLTACAASAQAVGEATELVRRGDADLMLSGGAHSMIHPFGVTGFSLLTALSRSNDNPQKASRPFDQDRNGFILGEGSAMLVLEELEHARGRGANIYGEVCGYASTSDAYRLTDAHPEGRGAISCLKLALQDARIDPSDVDYINAHGTSTKVNDQVETLAIKQVFGEAARSVAISSTKSMLGHLIASAGATELIISLLAIRDGVIPPTINYETPDPACDLDYTPNAARQRKCDVVVSNSFGFGGQNVVLIASRYDGKVA